LIPLGFRPVLHGKPWGWRLVSIHRTASGALAVNLLFTFVATVAALL
jgi:hypothetical protein